MSSTNGHPILPPFTSVLQPVQIKPSDQKTHYLDIGSPFSKSKYNGYSRISDNEIYHIQLESPTRTRSDASEMSFVSDDTSISPAERSIQSAKTYPGVKLSKQRKLCKSDSSLLDVDSGPDSPVRPRTNTWSTVSHLRDHTPRSRSSSTASNLRDSSPSAALSLVSPAGGQLEFVLFYNTEDRSLDITINQLIDITLDPEIFIGVLDVYEKGEKPRKKIKAYLKRNRDNLLELHHTDDIGFFVYVTLIPKKIFRKYTNVVFGPGSTVFNEKISLTGYSLEQLAPFSLCFHALCKFGRDGEPIVLGEVRQPLKQLKNTQVLPVLANLGPPEEELELEVIISNSLVVSPIAKKGKIMVQSFFTSPSNFSKSVMKPSSHHIETRQLFFSSNQLVGFCMMRRGILNIFYYCIFCRKCNINPFHANVLFLYPLKMSENQRFSDVFRGYRNGKLG